MRTVNIHEAKTHLSRLVDRTARGEPFITAKKSGSPDLSNTIGNPRSGKKYCTT